MKKFLLILLLLLVGCTTSVPQEPQPEPVRGTYRFVEETEGNLSLVDDALRFSLYEKFIHDLRLSRDPHYYYRSITLLVNKQVGLPVDFVPKDLIKTTVKLSPGGSSTSIRKDVNQALTDMFDAALAEGYELWFHSGYRSYSTQKRLYENYVQRYGKTQADTFSAMPGHSEHQTGLAVDITSSSSVGPFAVSFGKSREGAWVAQHAHNFGFIVRYPENKTNITGYQYEPWHIRYVGIPLATQLYESGIVMEELDN